MKIINEILQYRLEKFANGTIPGEIPLTPEQQSRLQQWNEQNKTLTVSSNGTITERKPIDLNSGMVFGMKIVPS